MYVEGRRQMSQDANSEMKWKVLERWLQYILVLYILVHTEQSNYMVMAGKVHLVKHASHWFLHNFLLRCLRIRQMIHQVTRSLPPQESQMEVWVLGLDLGWLSCCEPLGSESGNERLCLSFTLSLSFYQIKETNYIIV